ncbi:MAG TPA: alpha/beta fold hydrolase [Nonomuraea sp.]|nr:alpha/beta fold hydrolase [Nonomuraea sp.]
MRSIETEKELWIRRFHPGRNDMRLICFPHAGGSATAYFAMSRSLSTEMEVLALQYPGRQDRRSERCVTDLRALADRIHHVLRDQADAPTAFFGHSMGAVLAFEVAERLRGRSPVLLFASGRRAPSEFRGGDVHLRDDDAVIAEIARLDGTDSRLLDDDEVRQMVLPTIRGDYEAVETYAPNEAVIDVPIVALVGDADPQATVEEARRWERHTTAAFDLHVFPGGHFFLNSNLAAVAQVVVAAMKAHT